MATSSRRFHGVLKGSTRFQKVPPSSTKFYQVPEDSMEFQKVPPIGHRPRGSNHTRLQPLTDSSSDASFNNSSGHLDATLITRSCQTQFKRKQKDNSSSAILKKIKLMQDKLLRLEQQYNKERK